MNLVVLDWNWKSQYICIYIHTHIYKFCINVYMCVHIHTHAHTCTHTYMCKQINIEADTNMCMDTYIFTRCVC